MSQARNMKQGDFSIGAAEYYSDDIINIFYAESKYGLQLSDTNRLSFAAQYSDQQSTGNNLLTGQSFSTNQWGLKSDLKLGAGLLTVGYTDTANGANMRNPWSGYPGYTSVQVQDFNRADESAVLLRGSYDFSANGAPGFSAYVLYVHGSGVRAPNFNNDETDFNVQWAPKGGALRGLSFRLRYAYVAAARRRRSEYQRPSLHRELRFPATWRVTPDSSMAIDWEVMMIRSQGAECCRDSVRQSAQPLLAMLVAPAAQASFLSGEALDTAANALAWFVLIVMPVVGIALFWIVHVLPEKIAAKRHHPNKDAIHVLCLLSLVFGGMLWPIAWLWAYTRPVGHKMAYGTEKHEDYYVEQAELAERGELDADELEHLRAELEHLKQRGQLTPELKRVYDASAGAGAKSRRRRCRTGAG